jgi:hypothetical protein
MKTFKKQTLISSSNKHFSLYVYHKTIASYSSGRSINMLPTQRRSQESRLGGPHPSSPLPLPSFPLPYLPPPLPSSSFPSLKVLPPENFWFSTFLYVSSSAFLEREIWFLVSRKLVKRLLGSMYEDWWQRVRVEPRTYPGEARKLIGFCSL